MSDTSDVIYDLPKNNCGESQGTDEGKYSWYVLCR